jgi:hypothetical protein
MECLNRFGLSLDHAASHNLFVISPQERRINLKTNAVGEVQQAIATSTVPHTPSNVSGITKKPEISGGGKELVQQPRSSMTQPKANTAGRLQQKVAPSVVRQNPSNGSGAINRAKITRHGENNLAQQDSNHNSNNTNPQLVVDANLIAQIEDHRKNLIDLIEEGSSFSSTLGSVSTEGNRRQEIINAIKGCKAATASSKNTILFPYGLETIEYNPAKHELTITSPHPQQIHSTTTQTTTPTSGNATEHNIVDPKVYTNQRGPKPNF